MSFWSSSPGPTWLQCIDTMNPCIPTPYGLCKENLWSIANEGSLPAGLSFVVLSAGLADELELFLRKHFNPFSGSRMTLTKERIKRGFLLDDWVGVGVKTLDGLLVGSCVSKPLGALKFPNEIIQQGGLIDYLCVHQEYRRKGLTNAMIRELGRYILPKERLVHFFLKEGFPLLKLPPVWYSHYIARRRVSSRMNIEHLGKENIALRVPIQRFGHADFLPLRNFVANLPYQLSEDSELYSYNYKGHCVMLCITDLHHVTVPSGLKLGELLWIVPGSAEVPESVQRLAVETLVDSCKYDIVLMDGNLPHDPKTGWWKDTSYSWYCYNYNPGGFFKMKPYFIL